LSSQRWGDEGAGPGGFAGDGAARPAGMRPGARGRRGEAAADEGGAACAHPTPQRHGPPLPLAAPQLAEARFALVERPGAPEPLRVVRLVNAEGAVALSCMLHRPGEAQAAAWDELRARFGDAVALAAPLPAGAAGGGL
jgi:hypothetical protein